MWLRLYKKYSISCHEVAVLTEETDGAYGVTWCRETQTWPCLCLCPWSAVSLVVWSLRWGRSHVHFGSAAGHIECCPWLSPGIPWAALICGEPLLHCRCPQGCCGLWWPLQVQGDTAFVGSAYYLHFASGTAHDTWAQHVYRYVAHGLLWPVTQHTDGNDWHLLALWKGQTGHTKPK